MTSGELNIIDNDLAEIIRRLIGTYHPERIYLFGSHARGEAGPDSDYDIMVVVSDGTTPGERESGRAYEAMWGLTTSADILVWTANEFDKRLHLRASLPSTIRREGRLLYAA